MFRDTNDGCTNFCINCEMLQRKIDKIEEHCIGTLEEFNNSSGTNAYSAGRCIEAEAILQIIRGIKK